MVAGVRHQWGETLQCFRAVFWARRTPRCLPEPHEHEVSHSSVLPWHIPMLRPPVAPDQHLAVSWPASPGELGLLQERGPAPAPIYVLAVRDVWAGRDPIGPGAGSGGHGGGRGHGPPLPSLHAQSAPALRGRLSPRGAQGHFANPPALPVRSRCPSCWRMATSTGCNQ